MVRVLFGEDPVVAPLDPGADRYAPYREGFERAPVVAYIFHPSEPRAIPGPYEAALRAVDQLDERLEANGFTVLIQRRKR